MLFLILSLIFICIIGYWVYVEINRQVKGPIGIPIIFNTLSINNNYERFYDYVNDLAQKYNGTFSIRVLGKNLIIHSDEIKFIEHFMKTNFDNYEKGDEFRKAMSDFLGKGIFVEDGHIWYTQRKNYSKLFKKRTLKSFVPLYHRKFESLSTILENNLDQEIDVQKILMSFTLDTFCMYALGYDLKSLETENEIQKAFDSINNCINARFVNPFTKMLPFLEPEKSMKKNIETMNKLVYTIIDERTKLMEENNEEGKKNEDLLSIFMGSKDENGEKYSREYLKEVILNLMLAGRDTTGQTLTWALHHLALNPSIQDKVVDEIESVTKGSKIESDDCEKMVYLKAVINETLRLSPPVPVDGKTAINDDFIPELGIHIKKGEHLQWSAWTLGRNPKYWDQPLLFKPERWLGENGGKQNNNPSDKSLTPPFIPFNMGPRICLGQRLAIEETIITLSNILSKYSFTPTNRSINVKPLTSVTLSAKGGLWLVPKKRN